MPTYKDFLRIPDGAHLAARVEEMGDALVTRRTRSASEEVQFTATAKAVLAIDSIGHALRTAGAEMTPTWLSDRVYTWHVDGTPWRTGDRSVFSNLLAGKRVPTPWEVAQLGALVGRPAHELLTLAGRPLKDYQHLEPTEFALRAQLLAAGVQAARTTGRWLMENVPDAVERRATFATEEHNPSTSRDRAAQDLVEACIHKSLAAGAIDGLRPGQVRFLGEEVAGAAPLEDGAIVAIIDPLDGTIPYVAGLPLYCISIAFGRFDAGARRVVPLAGAVYHPPADEMFYAISDGFAGLERRSAPGRTLRTLTPSTQTSLRRAVVATHLSATNRAAAERYLDSGLLRSLSVVGRRVLMMGSGALAIAYLAAGRVDVFLNPSTGGGGSDVFAGSVILAAATRGTTGGAMLTDLQSRPWTLESASVLAAATRELHERVGDLVMVHS